MEKKLLFIISFLFLFSGCRLKNYADKTFFQGCLVDKCLKFPQNYIKSIRIYHEFNTLGIFDAMLLNDDIFKAYIKLYAQKNYLTQDEICKMLQKTKSKFDNFISFYVLAHVPHVDYPLDIQYKDFVPWNVTLIVNNIKYQPVEVKREVLSSEFKLFFGSLISKHKNSYLIKFPAFDAQGNNIITPRSNITLCFSTIDRKGSLVWRLDNCQNIFIDECNTYNDLECSVCENNIDICNIELNNCVQQ